jgi:hypothetical protein
MGVAGVAHIHSVMMMHRFALQQNHDTQADVPMMFAKEE